MSEPIIILSGGSLTDTCFSVETADEGEITWNVTKLQDAADAGRFGPPITFDMAILPAPDWSKGFLDRERVDWIKKNPHALNLPVMAIESPKSWAHSLLLRRPA